jgi:hypothetical protein
VQRLARTQEDEVIVEDTFQVNGSCIVTGRCFAPERDSLHHGARVVLRLPNGIEYRATIGGIEDFRRLVSGPGPEPRTIGLNLANIDLSLNIPRGSELVLET